MAEARPWPATLDAAFAALNVSRETSDRLEAYVALLAKWNRAINLVGARTLDDVWRRHILDSAQLVPLLPPAESGAVVDLGSGGGLPGLVLACFGAPAHPIKVHLIESDRRKAVFLGEAARTLGVDATVHAERIEKVAPFPAAAVTARALAPVAELLDLAAPFMAKTTLCLFLKSQDVASELTAATKGWRFDVDQLPSASDRRGVIVRIRHAERR